jgi:hypothetical protein
MRRAAPSQRRRPRALAAGANSAVRARARSAGFPPGPPVGRGAPPSATDCSSRALRQRCRRVGLPACSAGARTGRERGGSPSVATSRRRQRCSGLCRPPTCGCR